MAIRIVRLGSPRIPGEGTRLGTVRKPPRGVRKADYAKRDYYDVWFPNLAPSLALFRSLKSGPITPARWKQFARAYRIEMAVPERRHDLALLAALSQTADFSVGCYCEDERHCHRSVLRELLRDEGAILA
jgi:uncharacterized protein YeaO (DUF488 family)